MIAQPSESLQLPDRSLLSFLLEIYAKENPRLAGGSPATLLDYRSQVSNLQRYFDAQQVAAGQPIRPIMLGDITDHLLAGAMSYTLQTRSAETANKLRRSILALHKFAVIEKGFPARLLRVKKLKVPKRKPKAWLVTEVNAILSAAARLEGHVGPIPAGDWFTALLLFVFNTGTRISATMNVPTSELDLATGWVYVPAEIQKDREESGFDLLPITVAALAKLQAHERGLRRIFDDWPLDRKSRGWRALTRRLKMILVSAGLFETIKQVPRRDLFHKWRRCFASNVAAKAGAAVAQDFLGHSAPGVTAAYLDERLIARPRLNDILTAPTIDKPAPLVKVWTPEAG